MEIFKIFKNMRQKIENKKNEEKAAKELERKIVEDKAALEQAKILADVKAAEEEKKKQSKASFILSEVFKNATEDLKDNYRILILGGTGQGKTAFLNFLANA
jgi:polynucleotide 5'-kinase involved in rRNA processing